MARIQCALTVTTPLRCRLPTRRRYTYFFYSDRAQSPRNLTSLRLVAAQGLRACAAPAGVRLQRHTCVSARRTFCGEGADRAGSRGSWFNTVRWRRKRARRRLLSKYKERTSRRRAGAKNVLIYLVSSRACDERAGTSSEA